MRAGQAGFNLVELMITLSIAGILVAAAIPSLTATIRNNRLSAQTNEFVYALKFARAEAIKRGVAVTVCRSSNQTSCATSGTGWEGGWIVFAENAGNLGTLDTAGATFTAGTTPTTPIVRASDSRVFPANTALTADVTTSADALLVAHEALAGNSTLRGNNNVASRVTFNSQGMVQNSNGTFVLCDNRGNGAATNALALAESREIVVAFSGQARLVTPNSRKATSPVTANPTTCTP